MNVPIGLVRRRGPDWVKQFNSERCPGMEVSSVILLVFRSKPARIPFRVFKEQLGKRKKDYGLTGLNFAPFQTQVNRSEKTLPAIS